MGNPFRALKDWRQRALERARTRGALHVFWFYLSMGLVWSLFMFCSTFIVDLYYKHASDFENVQARALIYFVGGLLFGLIMWVVQEAPGTGQRDLRR